MAKSNDNLTSFGLLFLRVLAGSGIAYHGYQKIFGGYVDQLAQGLTHMGFPVPIVFAWLAALSEFVGGICLVLGLFTLQGAVFVFITMSVAAFVAHKADPLDKKELALAYWTVSGALICLGAGKFSLDHIFKLKK